MVVIEIFTKAYYTRGLLYTRITIRKDYCPPAPPAAGAGGTV
jgi:hypothetical protein